MDKLPNNIDDCIREALTEVESLMRAAFAKVGGVAPPNSMLDQNGLLDGTDIVLNYLKADEAGLAFERLIYMVREPRLAISGRTYACIESAGNKMQMDKRLWERVRPDSDLGDG